MSPTDTDIVQATIELYSTPERFDHIIQVNTLAPYVGIKHGDGYDLIICRGSRTDADWWRDLLSELARPVSAYPSFGLVPYGFGMYIAETRESIKPLLRPNIPLAGGAHSLGGPELQYQLLAHALDGGSVLPSCLFESPRTGMTPLFALSQHLLELHSYINGPDPVPTLPKPIDLILPWLRPCGNERFINVPPLPNTPTGVLQEIPGLNGAAYHNIGLVAEGVAAYSAASE